MNRLAHLLTKREVQVMQGVGEGYTNVEIADVMRVSVRAVETWKRRVTAKLGARNALHAAGMWIRGEVVAETRVRLLAEEIVRIATDIALDGVKRPRV